MPPKEEDELKHIDNLRCFIKNLIAQAERSTSCDCGRPPSLLLVGPPGAGKTYLVKQLSKGVDMPLFGVHTNHLLDPFALRRLFEEARAMEYPSLFFLDDINHLYSNQNIQPSCPPNTQAIRNELFTQLGHRKLKIVDPNSGFNPVESTINVAGPDVKSPQKSSGYPTRVPPSAPVKIPDNDGLIVIAATNSPWDLYDDHELLSRFRGVYLVGLPDLKARHEILVNLFEKVQHNLTDKEMWTVADVTDGFTPSDLMIVVKALNYNQFSFLIPYTGRQGGASEGSSDEETTSETESEVTEAESEREFALDHMPQTKLAQLMTKNEASTYLMNKVSGSHNGSPDTAVATRVPSGENIPTGEDETDHKHVKSQINVPVHQWSEKDNNSFRPKDSSSTAPTSASHSPGSSDGVSSIDCPVPSPDSALGLSKSSEDDNEILTKDASRGPYLPYRHEAICDSNLSAYSLERLPEDDASQLDQCSDLISKCITDAINGSFNALTNDSKSNKGIRSNKLVDLLASAAGGNVGEISFRYNEPPDALRNDNQAVDSDRDSETEVDNGSANRRVNFCGISPMEPLNVETDSPNCMINFSAYPTIPDAQPRPQTSTSGILRSLLDRPDPKSSEPPKGMDYGIGFHGTIDPMEANTPLDQSGTYDDDSAIKKLLTAPPAKKTPELSDSMVPTPSSLTPTRSEGSIHSEASSGSGTMVAGPLPETRGKADSEPLYGKVDGRTRISSDTSTATFNGAADTPEQSDAEESDHEGGHQSSETDNETEDEDLDATLTGIVNLDNLGPFKIKIITLADVLRVISKTTRSISNEEIEKYTDFMKWFATVARSSCPHRVKDKKWNYGNADEISLASTTSMTPSMAKKRRKPLKKVGRFILKALMFLLD